jgi:FKBP-type peptidyl-prolyl cis-trans isomerase FkpA
MSVSEAAKRPEHRGRTLRLLIAFLVVIAAGIGLAWAGTNPLRGETTESGVRIRTVEKGEGPFVQPVDGVLVEYEGRLADGTVFDDSARHGGPQPMIAGQVIPGFAEALTKMQKGGRYKIHIRASLPMARTRRRAAPSAPTPTSISTCTSSRSSRTLR